VVRPDRSLKTCQVSENGLTAFVKSFKYHANEDKKEAANLLLQFIKAQEAQISRMNDKADILAVNKIINQFKKATP